MERKIRARFFLLGLLSLALAAGFTSVVFHHAFETQITGSLERNARIALAAYEQSADGGILQELAVNGLRFTLIASDGEVLLDTGADASAMGNHAGREEFRAAVATGIGEAHRNSGTLGVNTYYCALLTSDGSVLRASMESSDLLSIYNRAIPIIIMIALGIMLLGALLSVFLTKQLVRPILKMGENLDDIMSSVPYPELRPFSKTIAEQQDKARTNARIRSEFTSNVSHELKTPLTSISGYAEMIENGMARPEDIAGFAGKIHNEVGRLITLIGDIIKLSELEEPGNGTIEPEEVNLAGVARDTGQLLALNAERAGVTLRADGERTMVMGNRGMLEELVYNLCDNAIRYNRPGGQVLVSALRVGGAPAVRVADTGIGIPDEYQSRIFERFYRIDKSRSKETGGTGLGLAIVKHIAIRHNAEIKVVSRVGEGTIITVIFPDDKK